MAGDDGEETGDAFVSRARMWLDPHGRGGSCSCPLCYYTYTQSSDSYEFKIQEKWKDEKTRVCSQAPPALMRRRRRGHTCRERTRGVPARPAAGRHRDARGARGWPAVRVEGGELGSARGARHRQRGVGSV